MVDTDVNQIKVWGPPLNMRPFGLYECTDHDKKVGAVKGDPGVLKKRLWRYAWPGMGAVKICLVGADDFVEMRRAGASKDSSSHFSGFTGGLH